MEMNPGETYTLSAWEMSITADGFTNGPYSVGGNWSSSNTSIATVDSMGAVTSLAAGQAFINVSAPFEVFSFDGLNCVDMGPSAWESGCQATVKPTIDRLEPDRGLIGQTHRVTVVGEGFEAPASVNVAGSGITANVNSVGPRSIVVDFVVAADAGLGKHGVTVTVNGGPASNSVDFFVQEPKSLRRDQITNVIDIDPGPGDIKDIFNRLIKGNACGAYRNLKYTLLDQDNPGKPIIFEDGVEILEEFSDYQGPAELQSKLVPMNDFTNNVGELADTLAIFGTSPDCPPPFMMSFKQKFKAKVGNKEWTLTTINSISMVKAADGTYTITVP